MNQRIILTCCCFLLFFSGCKSEQEKFNHKATSVIRSYIGENMPDFHLDSISILGIDSLTHLDYAYFRKMVLENHESEISSNIFLYIEPQTEEEYETQQRLQFSLQNIRNQIEECNNILINPTTDTTTIHYFLVATTIYGKKNDKKIQESFGFPMNKEFVIQEIDIGER